MRSIHPGVDGSETRAISTLATLPVPAGVFATGACVAGSDPGHLPDVRCVGML